MDVYAVMVVEEGFGMVLWICGIALAREVQKLIPGCCCVPS